MASLQTRFMGLTLANPIVAGASDLTSNVDSIKSIEEAGAGAIVLKSLFEEQIQLERFRLEEDLEAGNNLYGEMATIFPKLEHAGAKEHLMWVKKAREAVKIPVIASLNAVNRATWVEYAKQLADQGVDGLELNFFATPRDFDVGGGFVEEEQLHSYAGSQGREAPHGREAQRLLFQSSEYGEQARPRRCGGFRAFQSFLPARHRS